MALSRLSKVMKEAGLNVLAYTGYTLDALKAQPKRFGELLEQLDWLIDGQYESELRGPLRFRGSENQQLLKRQADGQFVTVDTVNRHDVQITLGENEIRLTGFPNREFQKSFTASLESRGILLKAKERD